MTDSIGKEKDETYLKESKDSDSAASFEKPADSFPRLGDHLEVIELIGKGGMGSVYKVKDNKLNRYLAVKVLQSSLANEKAALKRFEQEAEAAMGLEHPNLGTTYGHGTTESGEPYIVLDYYEGSSLSDLVEKQGTLSTERCLNLLIQICDGLSHAHKQGVVHRDLKPTNIIISNTENGAEVPRIVDFGIAKVLPKENRETHNLTETGEVFGSPNYMSPEQCLGFMLDSRSDVYSIGCLIYEMLTGEPPFAGSNPIQVVVKHINEEVKPFSEGIRSSKAIKSLESIALRCLEKDQINRYQTVDELKADLNLVKEGKAPSKYRKQTKQKREFTKRQVVGTIVGIAALVFYGSVSALFFQQVFILYLILFGVLNFLVIGGLYVAYSNLIEQLRKVEGLKHTGAGWWLLSLSFFFGVICLTVLPYSTIGGVSIFLNEILHFRSFTFPGWTTIVSLFLVIANIFAVCGAFVSSVGFGFLQSKKKVGLGLFTSQFLGLALSLVMLSVFVFPKQVSKLCFEMANMTGTYVSQASLVFANIAYKLDDKSSTNALLLAEFEVEAKHYDRALKILDTLTGSDKTSYDALKLQIKALNATGKHKQSLALISNYIDKKTTGKYKKRIGHTLKGQIYEEIGDLESALSEYSKAQDTKNPRAAVTINQARIHCAMYNYEKAIDLLTTNINRTRDRRLIFTRALINEKLGNIKQAKEDYRESSNSISQWGDYNDPTRLRYSKLLSKRKISSLINAYAATKVGYNVMAKKNLAEAQPLMEADLANLPLIKMGDFSLNWSPLK